MEEKKMIELEVEKAQVELTVLQHQLVHAEKAYNEAKMAFERYELFCKNNRHITSSGDWITNDREVRDKHQSLYKNRDKSYIEYTKAYSLVEDKLKEITELQSKLNN